MTKGFSTKGFTLIELLLYVGLASGLLLITSLFSISLLGSRVKNQTIAEVEQQGMQVMQVITQTIRNAEAVSSPGSGGTATSLVLDVVNTQNDPTAFVLSSGIINIIEGQSSSLALTNNRVIASNLRFQNFSYPSTPGTIQIEFTLSHFNPERRQEYEFEKTFISSATLR